MQLRPRMSFADLDRLVEAERRYELYDGALSEVPAPIPRHQRVAMHVHDALREYERTAGGLVFASPIDIVFDDYNVVQPDVVFFVRERASAIDMRLAIRQAPDLAVEVLSPATERVDRGRKLRLLARFGVRECWLIDPADATIELRVLENGIYTRQVVSAGDSLISPTLVGMTCAVSRFFVE